MRSHYLIFNPRKIRETIDSFARGPYYHHLDMLYHSQSLGIVFL